MCNDNNLQLSVFFPTSSVAEIIETRTYLTTEILQERINNLIQIEGIDTIDLSNFIIDLQAAKNNLSEIFYQELKNKFSRGDRYINLDLSNSIIQGNFDITKIGFATPLAEGAFSSLLTVAETEKIKNLDLFVNPIKIGIPNINVFRGGLQLQGTIFTGNVDFSQTWFLKKITANRTNFQQQFDTHDSLFAEDADFSNTVFNQDINLSHTRFLAPANFQESQFEGITNFEKSFFGEIVDFNNANFFQVTNFARNIFKQTVDFSQSTWRDRVIFSKSKFWQKLIFTGTTFEKTVAFRDVYFNSLINFNSVNLLNRIDFTNAFFTPQAHLNTSGLAFDAEAAKIIGDSGTIGQVIQVNNFEENQTILRNLVRNFRSLEQIADANQIEYQREKLHLQQLAHLITTTPWQKIFRLTWIGQILSWLSLSLLLLLGNYGTNVNLVFSVGVIAIAFFSLSFWLIDRYRPKISQPIIPSRYETVCMLSSYTVLTLFGIFNIFITTNRPWLTLGCIAIIVLPIPLILIISIYWQGRYHQLLDVSYFVENGDARQFRLMFGRMPIIPRFPFFRDRYEPILWDKRWAWLNYYDFSLNNLFKLGFNDIRLRDRHLPGIVATLVWYQWILGGLYIVLLLWTLSRTIPGLNLLIYF
ncbi:MAG: hypothetical protein Tsb0014_31420 [Pleurocapsa sp.]